MTGFDKIYNTRTLELAAAIPHGRRLERPDATASAYSKLCGSTITIDLKMEGDKVSDFGQVVKACLLGQAAASIVGHNIVGTSAEEFRRVAAVMRAMLKENGPPPTGRWADLALLESVRDYPARHTSTMLVFDAVTKALDDVEGRNDAEAGE